MVINAFGDWSYTMVGLMETVKGILAFLCCPLFGKLSDKVGRKWCLLATVTGTTMPVWIMAFTSNMWVFAICTGISGSFTATFPLTFAYISDCVDKKERAPAYGLALATYGLSFSIGPVAGAYLSSQYGDDSGINVFVLALLLVIVDVVYIIFVLPETTSTATAQTSTSSQLFSDVIRYLPNTYSIRDTFRVFRSSVFMSHVAIIVFLYYSAVWAVVSTLMIHVTRQFAFSGVMVAWLLSGYGLCTMFSEAVLVRLIVPSLGETLSLRIGLAAFAMQCVCIAVSASPTVIFASITFSMLGNLVYPSVSSLVSKVVDADVQGEAMGALNGIKALTEGFGPLAFGALMHMYENTPTPGAPYLLAAVVAAWAMLHSYELPLDTDNNDTDTDLSLLKDRGRHGGEHIQIQEEATQLLHTEMVIIHTDTEGYNRGGGGGGNSFLLLLLSRSLQVTLKPYVL
eukprot:gene7186-14650_t